MQKISKSQFLELVELSIAALGSDYLYERGQAAGEEVLTNLDDAIAEYVFWQQTEGNGLFSGSPMRQSQRLLDHWTHDDEPSN